MGFNRWGIDALRIVFWGLLLSLGWLYPARALLKVLHQLPNKDPAAFIAL